MQKGYKLFNAGNIGLRLKGIFVSKEAVRNLASRLGIKPILIAGGKPRRKRGHITNDEVSKMRQYFYFRHPRGK